MVYTTRARTGDIIPCQVAWTDEMGRPVVVNAPTATLFHYVGAVKTVLEANILMTATADAHRFIHTFVIPEGHEGSMLYVDFIGTLDSDATEVRVEQIIWVDAPLDEQRIRASF